MNWKLRLKNKTVLTAIISAILVCIDSIAKAIGFDITGNLNNVEGIIGAIISLLALLGVVVDPTTKGIKDSGFANTLNAPRDDQDPEQAAGFLNEEHGESVPMPPQESGEKSTEDDFDEAEPIEKLDSETPVDDVKDEDKENSPKG